MIKNIKKITKSAIVVGLFMTCFTACEKKEAEISKTEKPVQVINKSEKERIEVLTKYLSELTNAKLTDVQYNETTKQFSILGVDQISLEKLTKFYNQSKEN